MTHSPGRAVLLPTAPVPCPERMSKIPYPLLVFAAVLLAVVPLGHEPHLIEKLRMLTSGELRRPIDIFDLFLHGTPLVLLLLKVGGDLRRRRGRPHRRNR